MTEATIILLTHNRPVWFKAARASAIAQDARVMVVDDGSDPKYTHADIRFPVSVGMPRARYAALADVDTEFVAFLDDDDVLRPDWLERSLAMMEKGCDVVAASYVETNAKLKPLRTHILPLPTMEGLLGGYNPVNDFALIRRSILEGVTWHAERESAVMFSLWLDLMAKGARFGAVAEPTWYRRLHDSNMSAQLDERDAQWRLDAIADHAVPA